MRRLLILSSVFFVSSISVAAAQVKDKSYKDWTVYSTTLQGKKTCYVASFPKKKTGNYTRRDEPYFLVTRINDDTHEVSTSSGYKYKKGTKVKATVGNKAFGMFTEGELAWAHDSAQDKDMIEQMKAKNYMSVRGTSIKGTYSKDRYSLAGFTAAFDRMGELCK